jgi:hypothetical protein
MPYNVTTDPATGQAKVEVNVPKEWKKPVEGGRAARPTAMQQIQQNTALGGIQAIGTAVRNIGQEVLGNLPADILQGRTGLSPEQIELYPPQVRPFLQERFGRKGAPRMAGAPDAPILGVLPALPKGEESLLSGLVQGGLAWALASRGLGMAGRGAATRALGSPAMPAVRTAARALQPARAAVARATAAPGLPGAAARTAVATVREAPASAVAAYAGFKPEEKRVSDEVLRWVEQQKGTPLYEPLKAITAPALLAQSAPGDTADKARWKNAVEGLLIFDPASNAVVESLGLLARSLVRVSQLRQARKPAAEQVIDASAREAEPPIPPTQAAAAGPNPQPKPKPKAVEVAEAYQEMRRTPDWEKKGTEFQQELPEVSEEQIARAEIEAQQAQDRLETDLVRATSTVPDEMGVVPAAARAVEPPAYSQVQETQVAEIATDPRRFQFKAAGIGKTGTTGSLKEAAEYDPLFGKIISVWRDPADGLLYVVNGHNRLDLARRSGRETILTWEIEAPTAEQARAIGAMENMAEGMGTPWDAAKIMRDMGMDLEQLRQRNINVRGPIAERAIPLSRLPQEIFEKGATGKLDLAKAVALGSEQLDDAIVRDVAAAAAKGKWSAEKIVQAMQEAKFAQTEIGGGPTLPGMEEWATKGSDFSVRADVRAEAYRSLREEMIALTSAARVGRKEILEAAGNVINVAGSQAARDQAAQAAAVFNRVTGYAGPVRDVLNDMVEAVKGGRTTKKVVEENLDRLRQAIDAEISGPRLPLEEPAAPAAVEPEAPAVEAPAAPAVSPAQRAETKALLDRVMANLPPERRAEVQQIMEERGLAQPVQERLEVTAEPAAPAAAPSAFALPDELKRSAPRYSYGQKRFELRFASDLDKTAYILANDVKTVSKAAPKFRSAVEAAGLDLREIAAHGDRVRAAIKARAKDAQPGLIELPDQGFGGAARGRAAKGAMPDYGSVGEGGRFIRRLKQLGDQLAKAEGADAARLTNEMRDAMVDFVTPLWRRRTTVQVEFMDKLRTDLQRIAGPELQVQFERQIEITPELEANLRKDWGIPDSVPLSQVELSGLYDPTMNLVRIALADKIPHELRGTGYHEAVHYLTDRIFTPQENAVLRAARPELEKIAARGGMEDLAAADDWEIISEAAAVYNLSREAGGTPVKASAGIKGLFDKFMRLLDATKNWAQGNGFQTWDDVFQKMYAGEMAGRPPGESMYIREGMEDQAPRFRAEVPEPEGPVPAEPPAGPENNDEWVRRFAQALDNNMEALRNGEVTIEDLMANNFQKVQSPSGRTIYTAQRENLVEGLNAMSKVLPDRPIESGIPVMDPDLIRRMNQDWFTRHGEDSESIMAGLQSLTRGFDEYQQGALNRAMALADKKQVEAAQEAAMWLNSANFEGINESERLARLVVAAESSRATHQAVMRVTRRWGQLGLEMQIPRDYEIPANQNIKDASIPQAPVEPEVGAGPNQIDVEEEIRAELEAEQAKPMEETLTNKLDPDLTEAINGGEVTPRAAAAADALAQSLVSIAADSKARTKFWRNFDDTRTFTPNALLMLRTSNLISSGITSTTNLMNGMLNLARLPLQQAAGAAMQGELKRSMMSLMMFQQYWTQKSNALRVAGHAFKAGNSLFNLESSTVDYLGRIAKQEAQGELLQGPEAMTGWTVNTMNMGQEFAQKPVGQLANHLWRVLGTAGTRVALTIDTFNSTLAGYAYEHIRHLPRGMELAVERGMKDMSPEAWKWAQQYADARTQESVKEAAINGKNLADVHMDSPYAQKFMDSVNFTDKVWAELEPRTYGEGVRLGQARGIEGDELRAFAQKYVEEGTTANKVAEFFLESPIAPGRFGSLLGEGMDTLASARRIGPVFKFLQPFVRVPTNIIKDAMRNTPAAVFVDTFWRDVVSEDAFTRDRALGEVATGSAVVGLLTMASAMGYIRFNGGGPLDPAARQRWTEIEGRLPFSFQTWDEEAGKWGQPASMRSLEPFATLFGAIGDYGDIAMNLSTENRNRLGGALVLTLARMSTSGVLSKSYFQGVNEIYEAAFNPSKVMTGVNQRDAMARYLSRIAASMVPSSSALRAARREVDPVARSVDPSDVGGLMGFFQETLDEVRNAVPGWSNSLPARRDYINGQPILTTGIIGAEQLPAEMPFLQSLMQFTPMAAMQVGRQPRGPVHEEMSRLHGKGTSFLGPRAADFGAEMRLTPSELEDYVLTFATVKDQFGRTFEQSAIELIESEQYQSWPIDGPSSRFASLRAAAIQEEIQRYKELAKGQFKASTPKGQLIMLEEAEREADKGEKNYLRRYGGGTPAQPSGAQSWSITPR